MIDLHTHTTYSDGTWTVKELLVEANKNKIEVLSITDHDTLKAYIEMEDNNYYKEIFRGRIVNGIELNTIYSGVKMEILAYDFDTSKLYEWVKNVYQDRQPNLEKEFNFLYNACIKKNIKIGDNVKYNPNQWPFHQIFKEIKKYDENKIFFADNEWNNKNVFFRAGTVNTNFPLYIDMSIFYPKIEEVILNVRRAGGKVFLAHLYNYPLDNHIKFVDIMNKNNYIDGIEVYHSSFTNENINVLKQYCIDNKLLMCGGSDCHGDKNPNITLGYGNIKKDILKWIK